MVIEASLILISHKHPAVSWESTPRGEALESLLAVLAAVLAGLRWHCAGVGGFRVARARGGFLIGPSGALGLCRSGRFRGRRLFATLNPNPQTLNSKPSTLNPKP